MVGSSFLRVDMGADMGVDVRCVHRGGGLPGRAPR
jgi:hypothetical protein